MRFAQNALPETAKRVELLLAGQSPKQVEKLIRREKKRLKVLKATFKRLNTKLWKAYQREAMEQVKQRDLLQLSQTNIKYQLDTVATIYAWQKNRKRAEHFAAKALPRTKKRVELLLKGIAPRKVEKILATQKSIEKNRRTLNWYRQYQKQQQRKKKKAPR